MSMLSPPFVGAYAWILMFGRSGIVTEAARGVGIALPPIYGPFGIALASAFSLYPIVFLLMRSGFLRVDRSLEEAAAGLGRGPFAVLRTVTLPLVVPAAVTSALLVFLAIVADFGTPSILALAAADAGISVSADAGIDAIAAKATALTGFGIDLCDQWGLTTCTPREASRRGGPLSVVHPQARQLCRRLIDECGVIPDFREPDIVRLGMSPLTTRFVDVHDGIEHIARLVAG